MPKPQLKLLFRYGLVLLILFSLKDSIISQQTVCDHVVKGKVLDQVSTEPLPFATVSILESGQGVITDINGDFIIEKVCLEEFHLVIQFLGYRTVEHHHDFHHGDPIIYLAPEETLLDGVVIEGSRIEAFKSLAIQKLEVNKESLLSNSVGDLTESISGISILKTGSNISKPIVHGLHSNRVLVMNNGLRHAYQVWGEGHAPEIDPSHIDEIKVVKGAGTVKYGPEALGGVILYNSKKPQLDQKLKGSLGTSYQSNGRAYSGQVNLKQGSHRFAWNAGGFGIKQADLKSPNYNLSNTGKREYGGSFNTLFHLPKIDLQVSGSFLGQELGILRGSLVGNLQDLQNAIDRSEPNPTFDPTYEIQNPKHKTQHGLLRTNLSVYLGDHIFKLQYGVQRNIRKEFDVRRGELNERPVIDLELTSHNFELEWVQPTIEKWNGNSGFQWFSHDSANKPGSNPINFVPDYNVSNIGAYTIQSLKLDESTIELGVRFDFQNLSVADTIRDVTIYSNKVNFANATFTLGYRKNLSEELSVFANVGTAWRPPNVSELYSFGYHFSRIQFGLWRYNLEPQISTPLNQVFDETDRKVPSEKSLKLVSGIEINNEKINAEFIIHVNRINDYIYLRPFGVTTNVAGTFPYFIFSQTNAFFIGSDWDFRYHHSETWTSEAKISYVYARETENNQSFIEIPPLNINYNLEFSKGPWVAGMDLNYMAQQWNAPMVIEPISFQNGGVEVNPDEIFDFTDAPNAYFLVGGNLSYTYKSLRIGLRAKNLLNTTYRNYTDRLRYFSDAPGRNFILTFGVDF
ncbi:MAG: carboxypeptidase-like regulatory domain-containing protein [Saprospiraceae bacterium]|nr:carboxypeptidase-like regulatory domain-containing protein [Saprospiraceae bacterium]